jgi:nitroimidazol reductase NimA-like FMN-containing flavoprotein (pyridoxamine 5'-phosphate oxidase superfamily)
MKVHDRTGLEVLAPDECMRLISEHHLGRLAVVVDDQPLMFPVNYALDGRQIVFRTDSGTKLHGADGHRVAFEIDGADPRYHEGWSVLVVGIASEEHDELRIRELEKLPLRPWGGAPKSHWMRIQRSAVSGRRIDHAYEGSRG